MPLDIYLLPVVFWFALAGTLFAGYLNAHRLITKECPFNESCPTFFGIPACEIGFGLFVILFAAAAAARTGYLASGTAASTTFYVSLIGILYAGILTAKDLLAERRAKSALILPTCAYGLAVFATIFALSFTMVGATL